MKVHWTDRAKVRLRLLHSHIAAEASLVANEVVERLLRRSLQKRIDVITVMHYRQLLPRNFTQLK